MKTKISAYYCLLPSFLFMLYLTYMQYVIKHGFWLKGLVLSTMAMLIYVACFVQLKRKSDGVSKRLVMTSSSLLACFLLFLGIYVSTDAETALIAGVAVHTMMAFVFAVILVGKHSVVMRDSDTGALYRINGMKAHRLSDNEVKEYWAVESNNLHSLKEFSSNSVTGFDSSSPTIVLPYGSNDFNSSDFNHGIHINPSSGSPMVGGISGHDISGNSWGTNFSEPMNTYDPNRGY